MGSRSLSDTAQAYVECLENLRASVCGKGRKRHFDAGLKETAVSAALCGVSKTEIIKILQISWGTLDRWHKLLEPKLKKLGPKRPNSCCKVGSGVQVLEVVGSPSLQAPPNPNSRGDVLEIRIGSILINIIGGGAI